MNIMAAFKGDYLAAVEFEGKQPTWTIDHVKLVELEGDGGKIQVKPIVYFRGSPRGWVLCKTTAQALAAMFTVETDKWTGKRVTLFSEEVQLGKERVPGIRVKGSPDLEADVSFALKLPRKKPKQVRLVKTGAPRSGPEQPSSPPTDEQPEPVIDPETGEAF